MARWFVYSTVDQLNRTEALSSKKDQSEPPFLIIRTEVLQKKRVNNLGFLVLLKAKEGKEKEASNFVKSAVELAKKEENTLKWYAFQIDKSTFGVFDTFENESGREEHLNGKIAEALFSAKAKELFEGELSIQKNNILSYK